MNKKFTDIFIQRPVLATVISLLIFIFGLRALHDLSLREFPKLENTVITVTTGYPGASADLMQGFITAPLQKSIASAEGIDYLTSESKQGISTITVYIKLNYDPESAFTNVLSKVSEVTNQLPAESQQPLIKKDTGSSLDLMYISFSSNEMTPEQITDYIARVVQPKLETVSGVAKAEILGGSPFAMRVWLNPIKMASLNITPADVQHTLLQNNFQTAGGKTKGQYVAYNIKVNTDINDVSTFSNIVIKNVDGAIVRLKDVADIQLGSETYDTSVIFNGKKAVFVGIASTPSANPLTVITDTRALLPKLMKNFPPALHGTIVYDATKYIRASINEVIRTIIEATLIVIVVIFLFLGSFRAVLIPIVTIPLSLIGVCTLMLFLGYSLNLLTLLSMVLAIGLVVDDAIVVVENIHRHIEEGMPAFQAAINGAREIAIPVIAMTVTLAAVYAPIGFMGGLTGALFKEFAFTLASSVIISGVIALTLSPMMCSKILTSEIDKGKFVHYLNDVFEKIKTFYERQLRVILTQRPAVLIFAGTVLISCFFLYILTPSELAPDEDQSVLFSQSLAPQYANIDYVSKFTRQFDKIFSSFPETEDYFIINNTDSAFGGVILKPWNERKRSQSAVSAALQTKMSQVAGLNTFVISMPSLPVGGGDLPMQFVVSSTSGYSDIYTASQQLEEAAKKSGLFMFIDNTLKFNQPQIEVSIDRDKAAFLGTSMQDIGTAFSNLLSENYVNRFSMQGRSYQVIPQILREFRLNPRQLESIYVNTASGTLIPLSTIISLKETVQPSSLSQFQQLNSATLQGMMMPGKTISEGLDFLRAQANKLPKEIGYDYGGQTRRYVQEGSALVYTFFFAIIVIFLVLAAQFESFRDPLIVLVSVPMSICGALIPLNLGLATINIYTQVGLITLIGLISKHGILMVEFANKLQRTEGLSVPEAIEKAAGIRLRAILMTTAAMVVGVVPLILASGAGAVSRFDIGLVIATGMSIGTLFTLFVVPVIYTFVAQKRTASEKEII